MLAVITVTNLADSGPGSLRDAIAIANSTVDDEIQFSVNGDISLTSHLEITETLTITGPGQNSLTIDAQQNSRIFYTSGPNIDFTISGMTLTGGRTSADFPLGEGGAIRSLSFGTLTIEDSIITGNSTANFRGRGGAIQADGDVVLTNSTLSGNSTAGDQSHGGGIFTHTGNVTLTNSTLSGNSTAGDNAVGGGIFTILGIVTLTNSTLSGNSTAGDNADGGGIFTSAGNLTLTNSTLSGNSTAGDNADGGGIFVANSTNNPSLTIQNSIVAGNTVATGSMGPDVLPDPEGILDVDYSLIGNVSNSGITGGTGTGNLLNVDPLLGPLSDNGGPTRTHAPLTSSPAIDAGSDQFVNIARAGTATQSSEFSSFPATNAIDGDLGNFTATAGADVNSTWQVELAVDYTIAKIVLHSRDNCCPSRLRDITVEILDSKENVLFTSLLLNPENILGGSQNNVGPETITIDLVAAASAAVSDGRTVRVARTPDLDLSGSGGGDPDGANLLSLGEVEIFAVDQRGVPFVRVFDDPAAAGSGIDIGAVEVQPIVDSADFDTDGDVDGADFLAWQRGFGTPNADKPDGDANNDVVVDAVDLGIWENHFGSGGGSLTELSAVGSRTPAVGARDADLIDAALATVWLGVATDEDDAQPVDEQGIVEIAISASDDSAGRVPAARVVSEVVVLDATRDDAAAPDEPWLADELLERVFG